LEIVFPVDGSRTDMEEDLFLRLYLDEGLLGDLGSDGAGGGDAEVLW
jgi:hypothetical protein